VIGKSLFVLIVVVAALVVAVLAALETGWAKERIRSLIVTQANQYLTAELQIGRLSGSLFRGLRLDNVKLSRDGRTIVSIESVALSYSPRELWQQGVVIRQIRLIRPRFEIARQPDGRWNLAAIVNRGPRQQQSGPARPIYLERVEIVDGAVALHDPLEFGAAHVPGRFDALNMSFSFDYAPVGWRLDFADASWTAPPPDLTMTDLHGAIARNACWPPGDSHGW